MGKLKILLVHTVAIRSLAFTPCFHTLAFLPGSPTGLLATTCDFVTFVAARKIAAARKVFSVLYSVLGTCKKLLQTSRKSVRILNLCRVYE